MKACLQEERFLIFMSHQSDELSVSLCLSSCSYLEDFLPLPPHLSVGVIDFVSLCFSPPGSSTLDMRVWVCVCVSEQISPFLLLDHFRFFIFFFLCKAASLEPHLTTESMSSPLPSPFMSPLLYSVSSASCPLSFLN